MICVNCNGIIQSSNISYTLQISKVRKIITGIRKIGSRPESYDQGGEKNDLSKGQINKTSNVPQKSRYGTKYKLGNPNNKDHVSHANIGEFLSPPSSCSESNISEVASSVARVPSASSSRRDSSAYSDYEDYEEYLAYENIGNGVMCRIEMAEDPTKSNSKEEETFPLLRSSSFTEDRSNMLIIKSSSS